MAKSKKQKTQNYFEFSEADRAPFFEMARRFSQRLKLDPDQVADHEIRDVLGEEFAPARVRRFAVSRSAAQKPSEATDSATQNVNLGASTTANTTKARASNTEEGQRVRKKANQALRVRLFALDRILDEVDAAIAGVVSAPGRTNRLDELSAMLQHIESFRTAIGWPRENAEPLAQIDPEVFKNLLIDPKWKPTDE